MAYQVFAMTKILQENWSTTNGKINDFKDSYDELTMWNKIWRISQASQQMEVFIQLEQYLLEYV